LIVEYTYRNACHASGKQPEVPDGEEMGWAGPGENWNRDSALETVASGFQAETVGPVNSDRCMRVPINCPNGCVWCKMYAV